MRRTIIAVVVGLLVLAGTVGCAFVVKLLLAPPPPLNGGVIDLAPWLRLELAVGGVAAITAGFVARKIGRTRMAPLILAGLVGTLGLLEMLEILVAPMVEGIDLNAPLPLVLLAPVVGAGGVLLGGLVAVRK